LAAVRELRVSPQVHGHFLRHADERNRRTTDPVDPGLVGDDESGLDEIDRASDLRRRPPRIHRHRDRPECLARPERQEPLEAVGASDADAVPLGDTMLLMQPRSERGNRSLELGKGESAACVEHDAVSVVLGCSYQ
jgi:hypothetical protein